MLIQSYSKARAMSIDIVVQYYFSNELSELVPDSRLFCLSSIFIIHDNVICVVIKQNESEVDSDMLLVSDYFCTSNVCQYNLTPDTCEPYNIQVYITGS